jgi:hypothetical protein
MTDIHAAQQIYGNVEKAESPSNFRGFQTLFYSKDILSESDSEEIERRLGYYYSDDNPEKIMFFKLGEKFVTSHIVPLADLDKFGRKGAYIAHSFVFSKSDFEKINNNPFVIFDLFQDKFVKTLEDAFSLGRKEDQNLPPIEFTISPEDLSSFEHRMSVPIKLWNVEDIRKMVYLAMHEQKIGNLSKSFILSGSQTELRNTLKAIFSLIPDEVRSSCTFDTFFSGCNPVSTRYWAYCYPRSPPGSPQVILANVDTKTLTNLSIDEVSPYEKWLFEGGKSQIDQETISFRNTAYELDRYLSNKSYEKEKINAAIKSPNLEAFLENNRLLFRKKIDSVLLGISSENFLKYLSGAIDSEYKNRPKSDLLESALKGFDQNEISHYLFKELVKNTSPKNQEITDLNVYLIKNKDNSLKLLYLKWSENLNGLPKILKTLSDEEYRIALELFLHDAELKTLIQDSKISIFTDVFCSEAEKNKILQEKIIELIKHLLRLDQESQLLKIIPLIPKLSRIQIIAIQEYLAGLNEEKRKKIPDEFIKSLTDQSEKVKKKEIEKPDDTTGRHNLENLMSKLPFFIRK